MKLVLFPLQQTDLEGEQNSAQPATTTAASNVGPKRLHVSNIPFRFREADLKSLLGVSYGMDSLLNCFYTVQECNTI